MVYWEGVGPHDLLPIRAADTQYQPAQDHGIKTLYYPTGLPIILTPASQGSMRVNSKAKFLCHLMGGNTSGM